MRGASISMLSAENHHAEVQLIPKALLGLRDHGSPRHANSEKRSYQSYSQIIHKINSKFY